MDESVKNAIKTSAIGYFFLIASILLLLIIGGFAADYPLSRTNFTIELVTFRLVEVHQAMVIAPLLVATMSMIFLSKLRINKRIAAGISFNSFYLLTVVLFFLKGAGEFPYEILLIWIPSVFMIGYISSFLSDKI
jgi:hypothetical protein